MNNVKDEEASDLEIKKIDDVEESYQISKRRMEHVKKVIGAHAFSWDEGRYTENEQPEIIENIAARLQKEWPEQFFDLPDAEAYVKRRIIEMKQEEDSTI
jgi:hypothetical protein